ncbi:MAG: phosphoribosylamine--glycine ligase [Bacteroidetes bacterium]|nr:phosphoribosylamine--glycine ligase [Bacteroidota bacterium]
MQERILLIGSGGREHAMARALQRSASCTALFIAPGNPGMAQHGTLVALEIDNGDAVAAWCSEHAITLVVIGPEQPLAAGLSDVLRSHGLAVFGPSQAAARIESSKAFAKELMVRYGVPTAAYRRFTGAQRDEAIDHVRSHALPVVIKADGLAAGKGVVVATEREEAISAVEDMFDGSFGASGAEIVVEAFLSGEEASLFAVSDGTNYIVLASAQDHKRIGDNDTGKNTGGMGAYAPAPIVTDDVLARAQRDVITPMIDAMRAEGHPFVGCLYAGLMIDADGSINVVEFNCRFGDPETQPVLSVCDGDVAALFASAARGALDPATLRSISKNVACTVVLASEGYPDGYEKGVPIHGIEQAEALGNIIVYHAGTAIKDGEFVTNGGRVLGVTAIASTLGEARARAYEAVACIQYRTKIFRTDIALKGIRRVEQTV